MSLEMFYKNWRATILIRQAIFPIEISATELTLPLRNIYTPYGYPFGGSEPVLTYLISYSCLHFFKKCYSYDLLVGENAALPKSSSQNEKGKGQCSVGIKWNLNF